VGAGPVNLETKQPVFMKKGEKDYARGEKKKNTIAEVDESIKWFPENSEEKKSSISRTTYQRRLGARKQQGERNWRKWGKKGRGSSQRVNPPYRDIRRERGVSQEGSFYIREEGG